MIDLVSKMPWWAGIGLAILSYVVLHAITMAPLPTAKTPQEFGQVAASSIWRAFAYAGQYALPILCTFGAVISAVQKHKRSKLADTVTQSKTADVLDGMSWREFEVLVGEGFRRQGYHVEETGGGGADGGVDLILVKANEKFLVQCKQWKAFKVGVSIVRELYGVMAANGAAGGFVVTSGKFTDDATAFAQGRNIHLIDGEKLHRLMREGRPGQAAHITQAPREAPKTLSALAEQVPVCPVCHQPMTRRVAKRGSSAGTSFWGCTGYPKCRGTLPT